MFDADVTSEGRPFVVMELYGEGSLSDRLARSGPLGVEETVDIGIKICSAVEAAHEAGILHRDIKPQNILMSPYGPGLADFGIARAAGNLEWSQTLNSLTPWHAAPECFVDETATPAGDVYSLGSTLFTLLAGRPPFAGAPDEPIVRYEARLHRTPVPHLERPDVPLQLQAILERALAKNPEDRYRSPAELGAALKAATLGGTPDPPASVPATVGTEQTIVRPNVVRPPVQEVAPAPNRQWRWIVLAVVAGAVVIGSVTWLVLLGGHHRSTPATVPPTPTPNDTSAIAGPSGLTATATGTVVDLTWMDHSHGTASYFLVYRSVDGPQQGPISIIPGSASYTVNNLDPQKGYCFRLGAVIPAGSTTSTTFADASVRGCIAASPGTSSSP